MYVHKLGWKEWAKQAGKFRQILISDKIERERFLDGDEWVVCFLLSVTVVFGARTVIGQYSRFTLEILFFFSSEERIHFIQASNWGIDELQPCTDLVVLPTQPSAGFGHKGIINSRVSWPLDRMGWEISSAICDCASRESALYSIFVTCQGKMSRKKTKRQPYVGILGIGFCFYLVELARCLNSF